MAKRIVEDEYKRSYASRDIPGSELGKVDDVPCQVSSPLISISIQSMKMLLIVE